MKKIFVFVIMLCIFCTTLESCNTSNSIDKKQSLESEKGGEMNPSVVIETPPDHHSYSFESYQDVINALAQKGSNEFSALRKEQANYGTVYQKTLSKFESEEIKIAVPQFNGIPISLRGKDGYNNISLMTCELYNLPWLWYHCVVENHNLDIKISYLNVLENAEIHSAKSYYEVLRLIAPNAPSPDNYDQYASYKSIYEEKVILKNGVVVTAMMSELKNDSKMYVMFYYDNMLISLYADSELFTETFFKSFSVNRTSAEVRFFFMKGTFMAKKKQLPEEVAHSEAYVKDFFDMAVPSAIRFNVDHFICGDNYRSVWAIREYPAARISSSSSLRRNTQSLTYPRAP